MDPKDFWKIPGPTLLQPAYGAMDSCQIGNRINRGGDIIFPVSDLRLFEIAPVHSEIPLSARCSSTAALLITGNFRQHFIHLEVIVVQIKIRQERILREICLIRNRRSRIAQITFRIDTNAISQEFATKFTFVCHVFHTLLTLVRQNQLVPLLPDPFG